MVQRVNNFFLIAGEKSGDLYGSKLIEELLNINPKAIINYWGGDMMKEAEVGEEYIGKVKNIMPFGAFIEFMPVYF